MEQHILDAKAGRFPEEGNSLHTLDDIDNARKALQSKGLLMCIKDSDGNMCDIIPSDIANGIRTYYGIEIRSHGYEKIVDYCNDFLVFGTKNEARREHDYPGIVLTTCHSSKGLEWPIVFASLSKFDH